MVQSLFRYALAYSSALSQAAQEAVMKFPIKGHGELEIEGLTPSGLPAMRLVAYHSPEMTVNCHNGVGFVRVKLADIDLRPSISPPLPPNTDRDQLSRLGTSQS